MLFVLVWQHVCVIVYCNCRWCDTLLVYDLVTSRAHRYSMVYGGHIYVIGLPTLALVWGNKTGRHLRSRENCVEKLCRVFVTAAVCPVNKHQKQDMSLKCSD